MDLINNQLLSRCQFEKATIQRTLTIGGKYHGMTDLLFEWFDLTKQDKLLLIQQKQSNWIQTK